MASIEIYGNCVDNFEVSPFESINMLHRSDLERVSLEFSYEERMKLLSYDMKLVENSEKMSKQIGEVYDFALSKEPLSQWWWHLDKVANGKIAFHLSPTFESDLEI